MSAEQIQSYIERIANLFRNELRKTGAEYGLQPVQIEALHYLSVCNRYSDTPMGVTEYLGQTKGTVSQSLNVLARKGFLVKKPDGSDKRVTRLRVSPKGRKLLARAIPAAQLTAACSHIDRDSQAAISAALLQLLRALQRANAMQSFGVCHTCRYHQVVAGGYRCGLTQEPLQAAETQLICREHEAA